MSKDRCKVVLGDILERTIVGKSPGEMKEELMKLPDDDLKDVLNCFDITWSGSPRTKERQVEKLINKIESFRNSFTG